MSVRSQISERIRGDRQTQAQCIVSNSPLVTILNSAATPNRID